MTDAPPGQAATPLLRLATALVGWAFVAHGLLAMVLLAPRVPYADPWRFLARLLAEPFPANVVASDNGHREVLPNLLRLAELQWLHANQWLQIGAGVGLAVAVWCLGRRLLAGLAAPQRAAAATVLAVGLFWLGNGRKLAHGNESVHLFLVLVWLLLGLRRLTSAAGETGTAAAWTAAGCGLLATFSFGSGLACFPAFLLTCWLVRLPWRRCWPLALGALLALGGLWSSDTRGASLAGGLTDRADLLLRWLGAPSAWAFSPALDPAHAERLPAPLPALLQPLADSAHAAFGPHLAARWPALAFGLGAVAWLLVATWRCRQRPSGRVEQLAIGGAWFGVAVGGLVVALRTEYFHQHPLQITTQRYVPWSMLVWTGLLLAHVARATTPRAALWPALAFACLLAPSQVWTTRYAWKQRDTAEHTACGVAVGVLARDFPLEETLPDDLAKARPLLREHGTSVFAWPETRALGRAVADLAADVVVLTDRQVRAVDNRFGPPGCEVSFHAPAGGAARLVLFGADGTVRGIALRRPLSDEWRGFCQGEIPAGELQAAALR